MNKEIEGEGTHILLRKSNRLLIFFLVLVSVGSLFYRETLYTFFVAVLGRQDSSHGIFVPFISAYFLWVKFDRIKGIKPQSSLRLGGVVFTTGLLLFYFAGITSFFLVLSTLSFLCVTGALILSLFGEKIFKETFFPLLFLVTMIPLPPQVYDQIAYWMRQINTFGSVAISRALGVPLYREEFVIYLPEVNLLVSDGCSGIRYLLSYFTFSIVYAALFKERNIVRLSVVIASLPLSIFAGISRLSVIFLSAYYISPVLAEHRPHVIISWVVFVAWLFMVVAIDQYIFRNKGTNSSKSLSVAS